MKKKFGAVTITATGKTDVLECDLVPTRVASADKSLKSALETVGVNKPETIKRADLPYISTLPQAHMTTAQYAFEELEMHTYFKDPTGRVRRREDRVKELKTIVGDICAWASKPGYRHGELFLTSKYYEGKLSLDVGMLMENGVSAQQIKDSKKKGEGYVTNTFGRIADKDD